MNCDEQIDGLLSCSGEQLYNNAGTAGDSLVSLDASSGETTGQQQLLSNDKVTGQKVVKNYRERLTSVAAGVKQGGMGYLLTEKHNRQQYWEA